MTDFAGHNLPKRDSLFEAVTPVGNYGGTGHFVEYFGGADFDRNLWLHKNNGLGHDGTAGVTMNAWQHKGGGVEFRTKAEQWNMSWLGMGSTQAFNKDGFVMISIATRLDSSDSAIQVGMTSNGRQDPRVITNDASRIEFVNATNPSSIVMQVKNSASSYTTELWTSISGTNSANGTKRWTYQIEGDGSRMRGSINNVLEVTSSSTYPDEDMSPYCGVYTRSNDVRKGLWSYCECWNTGA